MPSNDRSRSRARSTSRSYVEVEQLTVTVPARSRSTSRVRRYTDEEQYRLITIQTDPGPISSRARSRDRSRSRTYQYDDSLNCVPCNLVRPSSTLRKRLIVCCDGTFCAADKGKENNPTNIARLTRVIANVGLDHQGKYIPQIVSYQSGVATGHLTAVNKATQGGFGFGLNEKVCEAYTFLVNNYGPGDEIFIFGFSRGAYTARSLASFICQVGLLSPGMMDYFNEVFTAYKNRDRKGGEKTFKDMQWARNYVRPGELGFDTRRTDKVTRYDWVRQWAHLHAKIKVVGVFDTVGSIGRSGWVYQPGEDVDWHATKLHPKIEHAFHALALDESRGNFPPTLFYRDQACKDAGVVLHQCWFPGYHSNIGGESAAQKDLNSVDEITFAWMIDQLTRYDLLQINKKALKYPIIDRLSKDMLPNGNHPVPPRNPQEVHERRIEWSDGKLQETETLLWHVASEVATSRWEYDRKPGEYRAFDDRTGHRLDQAAFQETIHPTVWHRIQNRNYEPRSMPLSRWSRHKVTNGWGFEWIKTSKSGLIQVRIPEYVIPNIKNKDTGMEHWVGCLEERLAPEGYLSKLDHTNGVVRHDTRPTVPGSITYGHRGDHVDDGDRRPQVNGKPHGHTGDYFDEGDMPPKVNGRPCTYTGDYIDEELLSPNSATRVDSAGPYDDDEYFHNFGKGRRLLSRPKSRGSAVEYYEAGTNGL